MKKKKSIFWICMIIIFVCIFWFMYNVYVYTHYATMVKYNWEIEFPLNYDAVYSIDSGSSFHGDGIRYHIFQYSDVTDVRDIVEWANEEGQNRHGKSYQAATEEWLDELGVPEAYRPRYEECWYYYKIQRDNSELILYVDVSQTRVYIVEYFL